MEAKIETPQQALALAAEILASPEGKAFNKAIIVLVEDNADNYGRALVTTHMTAPEVVAAIAYVSHDLVAYNDSEDDDGPDEPDWRRSLRLP